MFALFFLGGGGYPQVPVFFFKLYVIGSTGAHRTRVQNFRIHSKNLRDNLGLCAENMCNFSVVALKLLSFSVASIFGVVFHLILTLRSQHFDDLREYFCRRALGYLEPARSEKNEKMVYPT